MIRPLTLASLLLAAGAATLQPVRAEAATGGQPFADPAATARCIAAHLPQGAQLFRAADGSMRVQSIGRRGNVARWTITADGHDVRVTREGGTAGFGRTAAAACS